MLVLKIILYVLRLNLNVSYSLEAGLVNLIFLYRLSLNFIYLFIYFHIFTQGKPKQLTLVSIGALHTFHIVINMYVNLNILQYSQICASITHIKTLHV